MMKVFIFSLVAVIGLSVMAPTAFSIDEDLGEAPGSIHGTINNPGKSIHTYRKQWGDDSADMKYMHDFDSKHILKSEAACKAYLKVRKPHHPGNDMYCSKFGSKWILWGDDYDHPIHWAKVNPAVFTR